MNFRNVSLVFAMIILVAAVSGCSSSKQAVEMADQTGLSQQLMGSFGDAGKILGSISDSASAEEALPQLDAVNADLGDLAKLAGEASPEIQSGLSDVVIAQIPGLQQVIDTAYAIPGVESVLRPTVDSMLTKFAGF